jgi:predicted Zn-dependent protease
MANVSMSADLLSPVLLRCEGYHDLCMFTEAWEELEALPSELKQDLGVLTWRMQILMGLGEHLKASYIGLSLVAQFPEKVGILLSTVECLIGCRDYRKATELLRNGLGLIPDNPDLWLALARVEALLGQLEGARACVKEYVKLNPEGKLAVMNIPEFAALWS